MARAVTRRRSDRQGDDRRVNRTLGILLILAVATGLTANTQGTEVGRWVVIGHGVVGCALVVLARAKTRIAGRSLRRPRWRRGSWLSLTLAALVVVTLASGFASAAGFTGRLLGLTIMQIHIGAAALATVPAILHYRSRPTGHAAPGPTATPATGFKGTSTSQSTDRRDLLRTGALTALAATGWFGWERALEATGAPGGERRWTGSHEVSSGDPDGLPVTQWLDDPVQRIDAAAWRLTVGEVEWSLDDLRALPQEEITAVLDCTSLWWSEQAWSGVRLSRIVPPGEARSIWVTSTSGYGLRFPVRDLDQLWLALDLGGEPLTAGHGFPARIVAPGRRGFWWVKWVERIERSPLPWWVQPPYPLT
ncbi:molybdopterin-dependent oxidoreductase [Euzebya tangerina]|uniref:molybdopterin-dependent oxidoreductase n=1 Tax=Euzebya tangerina TaxID=591198 RepID=UPI000E30B7B8|nr:molybdopterin-dependent oxidoreductase [Euzebya tangerina]